MLRNICRSVWFVTFALVGIDLIAQKTGVLTTLSEKILNRIWMSLVIFPSIFLQCCCYWRIFIAVRVTANRVPPRADGSARNDSSLQKIAAFQLLVFIVCFSPLSSFMLLLASRGRQSISNADKLALPMLNVLNNINSIIDPIVFFVVFRKKWRHPRIAVRFNGREVGITQTNRE